MDELALGLSLGLGAGLAPGPLQVLVVQATLASGFAAGARVAAAPLLSDLPIVVICTLLLRELSGDALAVLSLAGAGFVAWLAREALRGEASAPAGASPGVGRAAAVNALSPHPWLFWVTVGGPLLVEAGEDSAALAAAFVAGFYVTLIGAKIALAALVEAGRRRGRGRRVPRAVSSRVAVPSTIERLGPTRLISAALLAIAAVVLLADGLAQLF